MCASIVDTNAVDMFACRTHHSLESVPRNADVVSMLISDLKTREMG